VGLTAVPRIEVKGLTVRLGDAAVLDGVDLTLEGGGLLAVIGPNGAGKTTLLRALGGLQPAGAGSVAVDGRPVEDYRRRDLARVVSYVPQTDVLGDGYRVRSFVEMGRYPHVAAWSALSTADRDAVDEALEVTETAHLQWRPMKTLSGGERQRACIAAALAQGGSILLLDEPTSFLDVRHQVQVLDLLEKLHDERGYTVVAVTHDLNGLVPDADEVLALVEGKVAFSGTARRVFDAEVLAGIFANDFILIPGGRRGLPLVVPARNGS